MKRTAVELFAGAGGLALGTSQAGFRHEVVIELDKNACRTIATNNRIGQIKWPLVSADVREIDYSDYREIDLVAGGPPCQPFSIGGKHKGHEDHRNLFPEAVRAVRELRPKVVMFENVKGLLRSAFMRFFEYVIMQLTHPEITLRKSETWEKHLRRLEQHHTSGKWNGLRYNVVFQKLNAADFGVPQKRERVIIVGFRSDVNAKWSFPVPTHSLESLQHEQQVSGDYWTRHGLKKPKGLTPTRKALEYSQSLFKSKPWHTVRDALADLPDPKSKHSYQNHVFQPGARVYKGHTGSPLDLPAKTLKAGDHGVPGGENMLLRPDGSVRYFTVRESARLQAFPDEYVIEGAWTESMRQLGNAVPVTLGEVVANSIRKSLEQAEST